VGKPPGKEYSSEGGGAKKKLLSGPPQEGSRTSIQRLPREKELGKKRARIGRGEDALKILSYKSHRKSKS